VIRKEVSLLISELAAGASNDRWMQFFDARMQSLRNEYAPKVPELFRSEIGFDVSPDQVLEITYGGAEQGSRILKKPDDHKGSSPDTESKEPGASTTPSPPETAVRDATASVIEEVQAKPPLEPDDQAIKVKKRGRKSIFTPDQLQQAYEMKQAGKTNNQIAKVLYKTRTPTPQEQRNVPTILKYHFGSK
jgi:hypothetical protein